MIYPYIIQTNKNVYQGKIKNRLKKTTYFKKKQSTNVSGFNTSYTSENEAKGDFQESRTVGQTIS